MRSVPALLLALLLVALGPAGASASSFPCTSYLHWMRHDPKYGEEFVTAQRDRWQRRADEDAKHPATKHFVGMDLAQKAIWDGELRYLLALEREIQGQDCDHFHYVDVLRWIDHRYHHLFDDQKKKAGDPAQTRTVNYEAGAMTALGTNRQRIVAIAHKRGVAVR